MRQSADVLGGVRTPLFTGLRGAGEPGQHHSPEPVEQDVVDRDPAMHDAAVVQVGEGAGELGCHRREPARRRLGRLEAAAAEPKRGQGRDVGLVIEVDQLDDAGMARELEQLGFPSQPSSPLVVVGSFDRDGLSAGTDLDAHLLAHSAVPLLSADRRATAANWLLVPAERASTSNHEGGKKSNGTA